MAGGTGDVPLVAPEGAVLAGAGCEEKLEEVFDKLGNLRRCKHGSLFPVPSYSQPCCLCLAQGRGYFGKVHGDVVNPLKYHFYGNNGQEGAGHGPLSAELQHCPLPFTTEHFWGHSSAIRKAR